MGINDFSSFIEVAATLNIALVAIEYVKTYTRVLCNQVFKFQVFIEESFQGCLDILIDKETLDHISDVEVGGKSTLHVIEGVKRKREQLVDRIDAKKKEFNDKIELTCEAKNVSSISLWLFLYGLSGLYIMGFADSGFLKSVWGCLTFFTLLYSCFGWCADDKNCSGSKLKDFSSLRHSIVFFVLALVISLILSFFVHGLVGFFTLAWPYFLPVTPLFMYSNFIFAVVKIWKNATDIKKDIESSSKDIKDECLGLTDEANQLIAVNDLNSRLAVDEPPTVG